MKTLSIIVPIYNVERYLDECLRSIISIDDIEIILVNDCTPDNSMEIAKSYIEKYNNIKLLNNTENKGLGPTRNYGIEHATGKYILFLDSDDYLDTAKLKYLIDTLKESTHDQILISYIRFSEEDGNWPLQYKKTYTKYDGKVLNQSHFKTLVDIVNLSQLRIIKREKILSDNIWFPAGLYEDVLWTYWFAYSCESTLVLDNRIYFYRQHSNSILGSTSKRHMELIEQHKKTMDLFKTKQVSPKIILMLENQFLAHTKYVLFKTKRLPSESRQEFCQEMVIRLESFLLNRSNQIKQLDTSLSKKSNQIKQLNTSLSESSNQIKKLNTSLSESSNQIKQLNTSLSKKSNQIKKLDRSLSKKSNQLKQLGKDFVNLSSIRFRYNPIEKIKAYRKLMKTYNSIKE